MRVLMLGWEFPPHISGGLGTHTINVRLNNLPELLIVDLEAEPKAVGGNG